MLRLQKENAKSLSMEDFGLEDVSEDESDGEPTLGVSNIHCIANLMSMIHVLSPCVC